MAHKHIFKAMNLLINDCTNNSDESKFFGNKKIIFGGDFRQVLPVIKSGNHSAIANSIIKKNKFWKNVVKLKLTENMRIKSAAANLGKDDTQLNKFSEYLLAIGEGRVPNLLDAKYNDEILIEGNIAKNMDESELFDLVYPDIANNALNPEYMCERAILSGTNCDVDSINELALSKFPGETHTYLSVDTLLNPLYVNRYPTEFLNKISAPGLPEHKLCFKANQPIILLRNIAQKKGLCNGTRLTIKSFHKNFIICRIATGKSKGFYKINNQKKHTLYIIILYFKEKNT